MDYQPNYQHCTLCPRQCGVNRLAGELGFCKMPAGPVAARAMLHHWEEPAISGDGGAGAVFFSGCTLRCVYCQNEEISNRGEGKRLTASDLRAVFARLVREGADCIDLVTPTHFLPDLLPALEPKLPVPVVYNCGGYERVETLAALEGKVDVYLPDLKYADANLAARLSAAADYPETAKAAIREMYRQTGPCVIENGKMKRGVLIRHLILPGAMDNTVRVLEWIADAFPKNAVAVSLMAQYTPMPGVPTDLLPLDRRITREEYDTALSWLWLLGLEQGYTQGYEAASLEFIPDFNGEGL